MIITQEYQLGPNKKPYTPAQWQRDLEETLTHLSSPRTKFIVLGNIPNLGFSPPDCLSEHPDQVQLCSAPAPSFAHAYNEAEQRLSLPREGDISP